MSTSFPPFRQDQDAAQAEHARKHCGILPRNIEHDGHHYTLLYRSKTKGGRGVFLQESEPGSATGHRILVFELDVVNGREVIGREVAVVSSVDRGITIASTEA
jgi:hypothetical protein